MATRTLLKWFTIPMLLAALGASAAVNTYTLTVTNLPLGGAGTNITINGQTRQWTNATTATTILTNLASTAGASTNLFNAYGSFPQSGLASLTWLTATQLVFRGGDMTLSIQGGWAGVVTNISLGTNAFFIAGPSWNVSATNRTNFANAIIDYASQYASTNRIATNAVAFSNYVSIGIPVAGGTQTVHAPKFFWHFEGTNGGFITGGTYRNGSITNSRVDATNGLLSNVILLSPTLSNGVNFGNAFSSRPTSTGGEQFGSGASATNSASTAIGKDSVARGSSSTAAGNLANALQNGTAIGANAQAGSNGVAIGFDALATGLGAIAIGETAQATHAGSIVIGPGTSGATNEFTLGNSSHIIVVPGRLQGTLTNSFIKGTNQWSGDVAFINRAVTSLANGNNAGVVLGTNVTVHLSGAAGAHTNCGFAATRADDFKILRFANPGGMCVVANQSGVEPVAANRIVTGTGGELVMTNQPAWLQVKYNGTESRWEVIAHSR